jgi:hypothetical protein
MRQGSVKAISVEAEMGRMIIVGCVVALCRSYRLVLDGSSARLSMARRRSCHWNNCFGCVFANSTSATLSAGVSA